MVWVGDMVHVGDTVHVGDMDKPGRCHHALTGLHMSTVAGSVDDMSTLR